LRERHITWHALTEYDVDGTTRRTSSLVGTPPPGRCDGRIVWSSQALGLSWTMEPADIPSERCLLESAHGAVDWRIETMAAAMRLERAGTTPFHGVGYAECLTLTVPPWRLPIDVVDWGHWMSTDHSRSFTWLRWRGEHPLTLVLADGHPATPAAVDGTVISTAAASLDISPVRRLEQRQLREIIAPIPLLTHVVPSSVLGLEETKWVGRGVRRDIDGTSHRGWAVFETVTIRAPHAQAGDV
jgi:hypothetical protein